MHSLIAAEGLEAAYHMPDGSQIRAVDGVSLALKKGEVLGIAGESGCGKSTLARVLALNVEPPLHVKGGTVWIDGKDASSMSPDYFRRHYRGSFLSVVPQGAMNSLNPTARIKHLAIDVLRAHHANVSPKEAVERAQDRLDTLGLPVRVLDLYPHQLSGGMKQRVVMALSTLLNPAVLIADEPTSALDVTSQKAVLRLLLNLLEQEIIQSVLFITHELPLLRHVATRIGIMYAGKLTEEGAMEQVIFDPMHPYTRALVGSVLVPEKRIRQQRIRGIGGAPPDLRHPPKGCRFAPRCRQKLPVCTEEPEELQREGRRVWCWLHSTEKSDGSPEAQTL